MKLKLTDWYPGSIKPVRKGFYQCACCKKYFNWDGKNWLSNTVKGFDTDLPGWRGVQK